MIQNYVRDDVLFELTPEEIEALRQLREGSGGSTPTPTKTPTPSSRVKQLGDNLWYVVDDNLQPVSAGFRTQAQARFEAEKMDVAGAFKPPVPAAPSGEQGAAAAVGLLGRLTGNPNLTLTGGNNQELSAEGVTAAAPAPNANPANRSGGAGGGGASGGGAAAKPAKIERAFPNTNLKTLFEWLHAGRITEDQLLTEMSAMGMTSDEARFAFEDNPAPIGLKKQDIAAQFDPSNPAFGSKGTFGSASLGQGIREEGLFTPNSGGSGLVPASDQSGNLWPAAAVVNNQLYTPEHVAEIARMRGMDPKKSTLSDIGTSLQDQNFFMERYGADPSRANLAVNVASGAYNPANDRIDPASGRPAAEMNELELLRLSGQGVFRAQGGPVKAGRPYIVGENRPEVFVPEQNGTILPNAPRQVDEAGPPKERIPRQFEYGPIMRQTMAQSFTPFEQRLGDPRAGMIATANPRLAAENPRRYYMEALEPEQRLKMPWNPPRDQQMTAPGFPTPGTPGAPGRSGSLFEKALAVSMRRQPMGMMG